MNTDTNIGINIINIWIITPATNVQLESVQVNVVKTGLFSLWQLWSKMAQLDERTGVALGLERCKNPAVYLLLAEEEEGGTESRRQRKTEQEGQTGFEFELCVGRMMDCFIKNRGKKSTVVLCQMLPLVSPCSQCSSGQPVTHKHTHKHNNHHWWWIKLQSLKSISVFQLLPVAVAALLPHAHTQTHMHTPTYG